MTEEKVRPNQKIEVSAWLLKELIEYLDPCTAVEYQADLQKMADDVIWRLKTRMINARSTADAIVKESGINLDDIMSPGEYLVYSNQIVKDAVEKFRQVSEDD